MSMSDKVFFFIQSLLKYNSFGLGIKLRALLYRPFFRKLGRNVQIKDGVTFKYPSEIEIGNNAKIGEFSYFVGKGGLKIGNNLLLGAGTKIITSSHRFEDIETSMFEQALDFEPIEIGNDVWFGFDVKVFGNTKIGNGVIMGANTIIKNTEIPDLAVVAGIPGKIVKYRHQEKK